MIQIIRYGTSNDSNNVPKLESILKELGLEPSKKFIDKLKQANLSRFPDVFKRLQDKLGYKSTTYTQFNKIIKISQLEGDVLGSINALADSGYRLGIINESKICSLDIDIIKDLSQAYPHKYFNVLNKLKEKFKYEEVGGSCGQVRKIIEISQLEGDVLGSIEALAESGYRLGLINKFRLCSLDVDLLKDLSQANTSKYLDVLKKLKEKFKYEEVRRDWEQVRKIIEISQLEGDVLGGIDALADSNYRKGKLSNIAKKNVEKIRNFIQELENQKKLSLEKELENLSSSNLCLYKGSAEIFIDYFSNLDNVEEKKTVLRAIFNCDYENKEIITWLDNNASELIREVGLESNNRS